MYRTKLLAMSALAITALGVATGTADAAPAQQNPAGTSSGTPARHIHFRAEAVDHSVELTTDAGSVTTGNDELQFRGTDGKVVAALPLTARDGAHTLAMTARAHGNTAVLRPTAASLHYVDAESDKNRQMALSNFGNLMAGGTAIGTVTGTVIGAGLGCALGGLLVGGAATVPTIGVLTIPGALGGCLVTGAALGAIGAAAGTVLIGGPVAVIALIQLVTDFMPSPPPPPAPAPAAPPHH